MAVHRRAASSPPEEERRTQSRQKLPLLPTSPEGAHKRPPMQGVLAAGRQNKAAGPTRSWSMPSTRGFPAHAHSRAIPQTGRSGFRAASRDDVLPLIRPKLVCASLHFSLGHVPMPREQAGGGDSVTMSLQPPRAPICACAAHRARGECEGETQRRPRMGRAGRSRGRGMERHRRRDSGRKGL